MAQRKRLFIVLAFIAVIVVAAFVATGFFTKDGKTDDYTKVYKVVALGDSFASGEGNPPYEDQLRHISEKSWQKQLSLNGNALNNDSDFASLKIVSCTGAKTENIITKEQEIIIKRDGEEEEEKLSIPLQIDAVEEDTNLVVMSIGGNDTQWAKLIKEMIFPFTKPNYDEVDSNIVNAIKGIGNVVEKIHSIAPNAKIIIANYPKLLVVENSSEVGISKEERAILAGKVNEFNNKLNQEFNDKDYVYIADVCSEFEGHEVGSDNPFLYGIEGTSPIDWKPAKKSFHPNEKGIDAYRKAFQKVLDGFKPDKDYKIWEDNHA